MVLTLKKFHIRVIVTIAGDITAGEAARVYIFNL